MNLICTETPQSAAKPLSRFCLMGGGCLTKEEKKNNSIIDRLVMVLHTCTRAHSHTRNVVKQSRNVLLEITFFEKIGLQGRQLRDGRLPKPVQYEIGQFAQLRNSGPLKISKIQF